MKVREMIRLLERDGWRWVSTRGSHRQFLHPWKPGKVTVPGRMGEDLQRSTYKSILKQSGLEDRR